MSNDGSTTVDWTYTDENGTTTGGSYTVDNTDLTDQANTAFIVWLIIMIVIFLSVCGGVTYCAMNKTACFAPPTTVNVTRATGLNEPLTIKDIEDEKKWRKNNL